MDRKEEEEEKKRRRRKDNGMRMRMGIDSIGIRL